MLAQPKSTVTFRRLMDEGAIVICNLSKGSLGEGTAHLLGALISTALATAALSRADTPEPARRPFYLYINEGKNRITFRCRVDEYRSATNEEGLATPWPGMTFEQDRGKTRQSDKWSEVFRTWFRIGAVERLDAPLRSASLGGTIFMPLAPSSLTNSVSFCSLVLQPRDSAAAAAFNSASCVGLSSASNAFWLTTVALRGNQALTG